VQEDTTPKDFGAKDQKIRDPHILLLLAVEPPKGKQVAFSLLKF
jgi:hypothetical protein